MKFFIKIFLWFYILINLVIDAKSQELHKNGDTIQFILNGYKEGNIQWQFSKNKKEWIDLKNETNNKLTTVVNGPYYYRAEVTNCLNTFISDTTFIRAPLNDYDYVDSIGRYLTSYNLGGRKPNTRGDTLAASFIDSEFSNNGLIPLNGISFTRSFSTRYNIPTFNIIGIVPGTDSLLKTEMVVISAHYDHLGESSGIIYRGADDNASGVAGLLLLARKFKDFKPKRTLLFIATGSEENGQQGIIAFIKSRDTDLKNIKYNFNYDMIGRLRNNTLFIYGKNYSRDFEIKINEINNNKLNLYFSAENFFSGSVADHVWFNILGIKMPAFGLTTGTHNDYHRGTDTWDKINIDGILKITSFTYDVIKNLDNH